LLLNTNHPSSEHKHTAWLPDQTVKQAGNKTSIFKTEKMDQFMAATRKYIVVEQNNF